MGRNCEHFSISKPHKTWKKWLKKVKYAHESALIGESESKNEYGLLRNHEYTVVEFELVVNRAGEEIQLVRLRNPWGFGYVKKTQSYSTFILCL